MLWPSLTSAFDVPSSSSVPPYQLNLDSLLDSTNSSNQMQWIIQALSELREQIALTRADIEEIKHEADNCHAAVEQGFRDAAKAVTDLSKVVLGLQAGPSAGASGAPQLQPQVPPPQPPAPQIGASGIKMAKLDKFDGSKRDKAVDFRISCSLFLRTVHASATLCQSPMRRNN
jgi:hypothetical protein